jgi:Abnormal spindle-like microcephaly-assoc'd, ASPM-SPD-2-Hydin
MTLPQSVSKYVFFLFGAFLLTAVFQTPAAAAKLTFNPSILRFGEVVVGKSESLPVTVTNSGTTGFTISTITATAGGYSVSQPILPLTLVPGQSLALTVTFRPTVSGSDSGSIAFNGNGLLAVRGSGLTTKSLIPNPPSLAFGNIQIGNTAKSFVTLTNAKNGTITVNSDVINAAGFSVQGLPLPLSLTPGQSFTFTISYSPQLAGPVSGSFQGLNPKNYTNVSIPLSGTGTATGQLSLSPASVSFGNVTVGTTASRTGQLSAGGASVTVTAANSSSSEFSLRGISLPVTLAAGQSMPYSVAFTPQSSGTASATLSFASNASTASESLTGSGVSVVQHSVNLSWNPSTSQVTGYNVYRGSAAGGPYAKVNSTLDAATAYTDSTVASAHTYYYVTTAVNSSGQESTYSNQVQVPVP